MRNTGPNNLLLHLRSRDLNPMNGLNPWHEVPKSRWQAVRVLAWRGHVEFKIREDYFLVRVTDAGRAVT